MGIDRDGQVNPAMRLLRCLLSAVLLLPVPALAQAGSNDLDVCLSEKSPDDVLIAACTRLINSGGHSANYLGAFLFNRGVSWANKGDLVKAIADYTESLRVRPGQANVLNRRGNAWRLLKEYDKAVADNTEALKLNPEFVQALNSRGLAWLEKREYANAIADFSASLRHDPRQSHAHVNRARSLTQQGLYDRAIEDYTSAIRLDPGYDWAHYLRGLVFRDHKKDLNSAIQDFNAAIRLDPKHGPYLRDRGVAHARNKNYNEAIVDYTTGLKLGPPSADLYANRGRAREMLGDFDLAIADYTEALKLLPSDDFAYMGRSTSWFMKKDYDRAIADYWIRSEVWFHKGNFTQSLFDSYEVIKRENRSFGAHNRAAWLLATAPFPHRNGARAIEMATRACELTDWKNPSYIDTLAAAHAEAGNFTEAVRWQQRSLEFPDFAKRWGPAAQERLELYRKGQPYRMPRPN